MENIKNNFTTWIKYQNIYKKSNNAIRKLISVFEVTFSLEIFGYLIFLNKKMSIRIHACWGCAQW
jgi:hypothetical protein